MMPVQHFVGVSVFVNLGLCLEAHARIDIGTKVDVIFILAQ